MRRYAAETEVPVERTRAEIETTLIRYGASAFQTGWNPESHMIQFQMKNLVIRFILPLPSKEEKRFLYRQDGRSGRLVKRNEKQTEKAFDQEVRTRWRALLLVVKAKLEAIEVKISTIEQEFLAHIVMPDNSLLGQWIIERALPAIKGGMMPRLEGPKSESDIIDAEVVGKS